MAASRGPAMLNSDMRYVEYSSTPPLAAADSPVAQPRFSPGASAGMLCVLQQPDVACISETSDDTHCLEQALSA